MENFGEWLAEEIRKRGMNQAQLAKLAGMSNGSLSNIINGVRGVGEETLNNLAKALQLPPETVFRAAGFIPARPGINPEVERLAFQIAALPPDKQAAVDNLIQFFLSQQGGVTPDEVSATHRRIAKRPKPSET